MIAWNCCFYCWAKKVTAAGIYYFSGRFEMVTFTSNKRLIKQALSRIGIKVHGFARNQTRMLKRALMSVIPGNHIASPMCMSYLQTLELRNSVLTFLKQLEGSDLFFGR